MKLLGLAGLRWGELAGLQVGDPIAAPGPGLRLQRSVLASSTGGELFVDTLKGKRSRTVPLVAELVPLVDAWTQGKQGADWLGAPRGGPLSEQRILRHASAAMTMDLNGHLIDRNLWAAAERIGGTTGHRRHLGPGTTKPQARCWASELGLRGEPPVGIEPTTYSLRVNRSTD